MIYISIQGQGIFNNFILNTTTGDVTTVTEVTTVPTTGNVTKAVTKATTVPTTGGVTTVIKATTVPTTTVTTGTRASESFTCNSQRILYIVFVFYTDPTSPPVDVLEVLKIIGYIIGGLIAIPVIICCAVCIVIAGLKR